LARSIYILGVLCKYFDVEKNEFDDLEVNRLNNSRLKALIQKMVSVDKYPSGPKIFRLDLGRVRALA